MENLQVVISTLVVVELEELMIQTIHLMMEELEAVEQLALALDLLLEMVKLELLTLEVVEVEMVKEIHKAEHLEQEDLV
jgi:hypothetical protein